MHNLGLAAFQAPFQMLLLDDSVEIVGDMQLAEARPGAAMTWVMRKAGLRFGEPCMSARGFSAVR
jgi:hypothetical protein